MRLRVHWLTFTLGLTTAGLVLLTVWDHRQRLNLEARIQELNQRLSHALVPSPRAKPSAGTLAVLIPGPKISPTARDAARSAYEDRLKNDPAAGDVHRLAQLRQLAIQYPRLRTLHLPPDQMQTLQNLLIERNEVRQQLIAEAKAQSVDYKPATMQDAVHGAEAQIDSEIHTQLGDDLWAQLQNQRQMAQYTYDAEYDIGEQLALAGLPLTDERLQNLALAQKQGGSIAQGGVWGPAPATVAMRQAAKGILTPEQMEIYQATIDYKTADEALRRRASQLSPLK